jgi:hypothetical protein
MKKNIILSLIACMLFVGTMQAQEMGLIVNETNGDTPSFALSGIDKIKFSAGEMLVLTKKGEANAIPLSSVAQLTFAFVDKSEINTVDVSDLQLYPNPVQDELFVTNDTKIEAITVFDLSGKVLLRTKVQALMTKLSLGFLSQGIYLIQVQYADTVHTQKIIKL